MKRIITISYCSECPSRKRWLLFFHRCRHPGITPRTPPLRPSKKTGIPVGCPLAFAPAWAQVQEVDEERNKFDDALEGRYNQDGKDLE